MMSQLAWEVEKKVECLPFPEGKRDIVFPGIYILSPRYTSHYYSSYIILCGPQTTLWPITVTLSQEKYERI